MTLSMNREIEFSIMALAEASDRSEKLPTEQHGFPSGSTSKKGLAALTQAARTCDEEESDNDDVEGRNLVTPSLNSNTHEQNNADSPPPELASQKSVDFVCKVKMAGVSLLKDLQLSAPRITRDLSMETDTEEEEFKGGDDEKEVSVSEAESTPTVTKKSAKGAVKPGLKGMATADKDYDPNRDIVLGKGNLCHPATKAMRDECQSLFSSYDTSTEKEEIVFEIFQWIKRKGATMYYNESYLGGGLRRITDEVEKTEKMKLYVSNATRRATKSEGVPQRTSQAPSRKKSAKRKIESSNAPGKLSSLPKNFEPGDDDVVLGQGRHNVKEGNVKYRRYCVERLDEFVEGDLDMKYALVQDVIEEVQSNGGKFVSSKGDRYELVARSVVEDRLMNKMKLLQKGSPSPKKQEKAIITAGRPGKQERGKAKERQYLPRDFEPESDDVVVVPGRQSQLAGNMKYKSYCSDRLDEFIAGNKEEKYSLVLDVIEEVKCRGGNFVSKGEKDERGQKDEKFYVLDQEGIEKRVMGMMKQMENRKYFSVTDVGGDTSLLRNRKTVKTPALETRKNHDIPKSIVTPSSPMLRKFCVETDVVMSRGYHNKPGNVKYYELCRKTVEERGSWSKETASSVVETMYARGTKFWIDSGDGSLERISDKEELLDRVVVTLMNVSTYDAAKAWAASPQKKPKYDEAPVTEEDVDPSAHGIDLGISDEESVEMPPKCSLEPKVEAEPGVRVAVWWGDDATFYDATVEQAIGAYHKIAYDIDGEVEWLNFEKEVVRFLAPKS